MATDLLDCFLADALTDIEVASRDLQISNASFVRLRRALGRMACAQAVLAATSAGRVGASDDDWALRMRMRLREAVELLAKGWPEDYPAGAVEFEILSELSKRRRHLLNAHSSGRISKEDISV
ncbi:hypothetical protein LMG27177_03636 [Paraburkholderia fynbosensis]|uniref:Uncharacterized protein n=2 Tax=Paraburkholderia fynbosensis TaxID=1200993 RepID=A0A6J5G684_9BURK|nr:hypothetical protein LMG27177_03636 [Paraburkholderia fynbosensis]